MNVMNAPFDIQYEWLPRQRGDELELGTVARLTILVNGLCMTEFEDRFTNTTHRAPGLSALRMARWFAGNWWRLRWEPENAAPKLDWHLSHNLATAGGGYLWPSLTFGSDGETVLVRSLASSPTSTEPVRYLRDYSGVIMSGDFERTIDDLIETVLSQLPDESAADTDLAELWAIITDERKDPELYALRKLEAGLGCDPGEAPEALLAGLHKERSEYGPGAVQEIATASQDQALRHLRVLGEDASSQDVLAHVPNCDAIRQRCNEQGSASDLPWQRGVRAAQLAREVWGLDSGRVRTGTLSDLFGLNLLEYSPGKLPISAGLRDDDNIEDKFRVSLSQRPLTGRRFALSRLVADHLIAPPGERLLPATRARTSRQKFQRAFAREFLCPINDLQEFLGATAPGDDDIDDAAAHFEVSPLTIKTTLVNKGLLERETLGEWAA